MLERTAQMERTDVRAAPTKLPAATSQHDRLERACAGLNAPFALVDLDAFWANYADLLRRAGGRPIRLASKSVRCRYLIEAVLGRGMGFQGVLGFTLPEALWLSEHDARGLEDIVVAYPSTDTQALRRWAAHSQERPEKRITLMVDSAEQLDFIEQAVGKDAVKGLRVCLDLDAAFWALGGRVRLGAQRSPVHSVRDAVTLAEDVVARGFKLAGLMAYEAQIAGVGDRPKGKPMFALGVRAMQSRSTRELAQRRAEVVAAVSKVAPLKFVNGGGTGSLERTAAEPAVTELAAGSGLFAPTLFDTYRAFTPRAAAFFCLPVVRRPREGVVTVLGGGYIASGSVGADRRPTPVYPEGLSLTGNEGAGEVQTPLEGAGADRLKIGDRVYFRHAKAGELCERFDRLYLVDKERIVNEVPTYRGEGKTFL